MIVKSCPITFESVDENVVRMHAAFIAILAMVFIWTGSLYVLLFLLYDFAIRVAGYRSYSSIFLVSRYIIKKLSIKTALTDMGPKAFATKIGLGFMFIATGLLLSNYLLASVIVMAILAVCAILEAIFNYCVGCQFYAIWQSLVKS